MKILFLSSRIPYPPDRGDKVRSLFILQTLAALGELSLVCLVQPDTDRASMEHLSSILPEVHYIPHGKKRSFVNLLGNIIAKLPFQVAYYHNTQLSKLLSKLFAEKQYDVIYTHLIRMAPYVKHSGKAKVILDYTDCISMEYKRSLKHRNLLMKLFFSIEAQRTAAYEHAISHSFSENWVISPVDLKALHLDKHKKSVILPNMVDIPESLPGYNFKGKLIFCGNMSVAHNIVAAIAISTTIMPALISKFPNLRFVIVGASPVPAIQALDGKANTHVLGFVDDLYAELQSSDVFIAPMYFSAGIQNKVLEAMACAVPVITTPNVAESLGCRNAAELITASDNKEFVDRTIKLLEDQNLRQHVGETGRNYIESHFSRKAVTDLIKQRVNSLLDV